MMDRNNLSTPEKFKYIAILAGSWVSIVLARLWVAKSPKKPMTHTLQFWGMAMMFWTLMAAVYSIVFLLKILIGKCDQSWKVILFPTIILWIVFALYGNI